MENTENFENQPYAEPQSAPYTCPEENIPVDPPQQTAPEKAKKGTGKAIVKGLCVLVLAAGLVAGSSLATGWLISRDLDNQIRDLEQQVEELEKNSAKQPNKGSSGIQTAPTPSDSTQTQPPASGAMTPAQVYEANQASVVLVNAEVPGTYYSSGGTSAGTGFILTSDGYVVTNYHVVEGSSSVSIITTDNAKHPATLIGYDNANDVALLKIEAEDLPAVTLGDSDSLIVGDQVAAIGNPLGELTSTLTVGYVSAKERDVNTSGFAINMIQTDAAINSGNSGGPLFNMYGQVIGITTAKYSGSSSSGATIEGIGFAIPINDVQDLLEDLVTNGYSTSPYLGVSVSDMNAEAAAYYGMPVGVYVNEVVEGYCSAKAGMQAKDIIVAIDTYTVETVNDLSRVLRNFEPGDTVEVTVYRGGGEMKLTVTLDEKPVDSTQSDQELSPLPQQEQPDANDWLEGLFPYGN